MPKDSKPNEVETKQKEGPRCATPALDMILANWKQEKSPYDDPAYDVPTCQREKILPESVKKQPRCATPAMDEIRALEAEYDQRIATGETEEMILQSWKDRGAGWVK